MTDFVVVERADRPAPGMRALLRHLATPRPRYELPTDHKFAAMVDDYHRARRDLEE